MNKLDLLLEEQHMAHIGGRFRPCKYRREKLRLLASVIKKYDREIIQALYDDLGKCEFEARSCELAVVMDELAMFCRKLRKFMRPRHAATSLMNFPASGRLYSDSYGQVLIFSAWNYPFQLMMLPLIGAVAAGNAVIAKPAEQAPHTARVIEKIIGEVFHQEHVAVIQGGREIAEELLTRRFDYIFYTGGGNGGRAVLRAAAEYLTPVTLELGGKSPCVVDLDADINLAAKRIVWGKFLNAGQTCVAPDYVLVEKSRKDELVEKMRHWIVKFYGEDPAQSPDYPRIINDTHLKRLLDLHPQALHDSDKKYIAPTLIPDAAPQDKVMQEEIFGPLLPILEFDKLSMALDFINERPKPLALYYFGKQGQKRVIRETSSGGVCINDTVMHLVNPAMPFGGVGGSGMGAYHGKYSFDTFTHYKPVMKKSTLIDLPMRYPPLLNRSLKLLKFLTK